MSTRRQEISRNDVDQVETHFIRRWIATRLWLQQLNIDSEFTANPAILSICLCPKLHPSNSITDYAPKALLARLPESLIIASILIANREADAESRLEERDGGNDQWDCEEYAKVNIAVQNIPV